MTSEREIEALASEMDRFPDEFNGDDAKLIACIEALLSLDAKNALVPHGIGGHARGLLSAAMHRLARRLQPARVPHTDASVDAMQSKMADLGFVVPVRVISEGMLAAISAAPAPEAGKAEAVAWQYQVAGQWITDASDEPWRTKGYPLRALGVIDHPAPPPAEPDAGQRDGVEALATELRALYRHYVNTLESARDQIIARGGSCDPVDAMEKSDPVLQRVRNVLEARRLASAPQPTQRGGAYLPGTYWRDPKNGRLWSEVDARFEGKNTLGWEQVEILTKPEDSP